MGWRGHLSLDYRRSGDRTSLFDRHSGPLRVLKRLYPETPAVCHTVLVHPPGGVVGGDTLAIDATLGEGSHALLTTPGATRFYRSAGEPALQTLAARLGAGSRLEWLPLEAIVHSGALAEGSLRFELAESAETIGWDLLALGLPASGLPFVAGSYRQRIEMPGVWLENGRIDAADTLLLDSPLGLVGHRVLATMWFAAGSPLGEPRRERLVDAARELLAADGLRHTAGATSPHPRLIVLRVLAERVEPAMRLLVAVWSAWRREGWQLAACAPRVWRT